MGHFGDEVLHLGGGLCFLLLLLAQGDPHGVQAAGQRRQLIISPDGDGVVEVAALHGLDFLTELDDIFHNAAAGKPEHHQKHTHAENDQQFTEQDPPVEHHIAEQLYLGRAIRELDRIKHLPALTGFPFLIRAISKTERKV